MKNIKVNLFVHFLILFVGSNVMTVETNSESENVLLELRDNQILGMECALFSNSIKVFIIEYQNMFDSLNIACHLHVRAATEELQSTVEEMVDPKLNNYLVNLEEMNLDQEYKDELEQLKLNFMKIIKTKNNITTLTEKCKNINENLTRIMEEKNILEEIFKRNENILNQTIVQFQIKLKSMEINFRTKMEENNNNVSKQIKYLQKAKQLFVKSNRLDRDLLIASIYDNNLFNAESVIEFLNSLLDDEANIHGYRLLLDQMIRNNHVYSTPTTTIAYRVFLDFNKSYGNNENLFYIRLVLPQSLKNFKWNELVTIQNEKYKKNILMPDNRDYFHDNLRAIPVIYRIETNYSHEAIKLIPMSNGKYFHILSKALNVYLYAETDEFAWDRNRRAVFAWLNKNETRQMGQWQLESIEGSQSFKIKNVFFNEYLSVVDGLRINDHLKLFTISACSDDNCKWNFLKSTFLF